MTGGAVDAADLRTAAVSLSAGLNLRPGDRVVLRSADPGRQLVGALAVLHAGGDLGVGVGVDVAVLDPAWPGSVTRAAIQGCGASVALDLDHANNLDDVAWDDRAAVTRLGPPPAPARWPGWIAFTSGSTGAPRAIRRTLRSWTASHPAFDALTGIGPADRVLVPGSLSSSMCAFAALHAVAAGARLVLLPRWDPAAVASTDVVHLVPTMLTDLLRATPDDVEPRLLISAGSTLGPGPVDAVARRWPRTRLLEYYGSTEQSFVTVRRDGPATTVGSAFPGVEVRIGDPGADPVPAGQPGPIWVRSPYTADEVLDGAGTIPLGTRGWVSVGDRGHLDGAGRLTLLGRTRIVCGGVVVEPGTVEAALRAAGAGEVVVLGLPHPRLGEVVCAVVEAGPGVAALRARVRSVLRPVERPRVWLAASPLPRTPAGKPDRAGLCSAAAAGRLPRLR